MILTQPSWDGYLLLYSPKSSILGTEAILESREKIRIWAKSLSRIHKSGIVSRGHTVALKEGLKVRGDFSFNSCRRSEDLPIFSSDCTEAGGRVWRRALAASTASQSSASRSSSGHGRQDGEIGSGQKPHSPRSVEGDDIWFGHLVPPVRSLRRQGRIQVWGTDWEAGGGGVGGRGAKGTGMKGWALGLNGWASHAPRTNMDLGGWVVVEVNGGMTGIHIRTEWMDQKGWKVEQKRHR